MTWTETNLSDVLCYLLAPATTSTSTRVTELQTTASCKCLWYGLILFSILERLFLTHLQCYFITVFCKLSLQWVSEAYILKPKENVKTVDCKNSVNTLILKKYLHVSTGFIYCPCTIFPSHEISVTFWNDCIERWNSNLPDKNKGLQIVTLAGKETEKKKSSVFSCWVSNSAIMPGKDLGYTLEIGMHRNSTIT